MAELSAPFVRRVPRTPKAWSSRIMVSTYQPKVLDDCNGPGHSICCNHAFHNHGVFGIWRIMGLSSVWWLPNALDDIIDVMFETRKITAIITVAANPYWSMIGTMETMWMACFRSLCNPRLSTNSLTNTPQNRGSLRLLDENLNSRLFEKYDFYNYHK